jgi:Cdc6-like AAA superfamily ATPase
MADPLSIAASIAGILSLADTVVTRLIKYAKSVKGAGDEAKAWANEVNDFGGTIDRLARLTRALEAQGEAFDHTMRMHHIEGCHRVLSNIDDLLKKAERGLENPNQLTALQRKLKWPLSSGPRIKELMSTLSEHKTRIIMALSADSMNGILECLALSTSILDEVRDTRRITARIEENLETERVLSFFLKPEVNPQERYETSLRLRHPRTGLWLLRHPDFLTWIDAPGSKLWLTGIPGAGKTVLAGSVVEEALARRSENVAVAFFFCDYKDEKTHLPVNILGALAYQLAIQSDEAYAVLSQYYDELHPPRQMAQNPTIGGLQNTLSEMLAQYDRTYLIVDGLDECGEHVDDVVEAITSWVEDEDGLNIALLSRDQTNIRGYLKDGYSILETAAQTEDVEQYVRAQIEERIRTRRLRLHDPLLKDEIVQGLTEGAKGMYVSGT